MFNLREAVSKRADFTWRSSDTQFRLRQFSPASLAVINIYLWWHCTLSGDVLSVPSSTKTPRGQGVGTSYKTTTRAPARGLFVKFPTHVPIVEAVTQPFPASNSTHCRKLEGLHFVTRLRVTDTVLTEVPTVVKSAQQDPIYLDLKSLAPSPISLDRLSKALANYGHRTDADIIVNGFSNGFNLHFTGPRQQEI
ncbi:hypothetical protein DPMN_119843 [Dreissena polymorpha]|uniref:Uncharacterized protein n=1 Tax=Dreissena polymorpha TaxID=45954 RepID=A0A9D4JSA2_DREPO|nr:hypothetical protein DPMN_119843 [Dreissena polymorpha]